MGERVPASVIRRLHPERDSPILTFVPIVNTITYKSYHNIKRGSLNHICEACHTVEGLLGHRIWTSAPIPKSPDFIWSHSATRRLGTRSPRNDRLGTHRPTSIGHLGTVSRLQLYWVVPKVP